VKLLLDENLSNRLARRLADLFPETTHVSDHGLLQSSDVVVWDFAKKNGLCVVTADADFYELATTLGPPPKVIWLRGCDYPTAVAEALLRTQAVRVWDFLQDKDRAVLILRPVVPK
jgi:predicted nuclease of predicted toxin-antitoxin system